MAIKHANFTFPMSKHSYLPMCTLVSKFLQVMLK